LNNPKRSWPGQPIRISNIGLLNAHFNSKAVLGIGSDCMGCSPLQEP